MLHHCFTLFRSKVERRGGSFEHVGTTGNCVRSARRRRLYALKIHMRMHGSPWVPISLFDSLVARSAALLAHRARPQPLAQRGRVVDSASLWGDAGDCERASCVVRLPFSSRACVAACCVLALLACLCCVGLWRRLETGNNSKQEAPSITDTTSHRTGLRGERCELLRCVSSRLSISADERRDDDG